MIFPLIEFRNSLTVLTAVKVFVDVMMLHNTTFHRDADLLLRLRAAKWLLSSAAREMHTCTLASYVIIREGCTAHCSWLTICLAWVEKFILGLGILFFSFVSKMFQKVKETYVVAMPKLLGTEDVEISTKFQNIRSKSATGNSNIEIPKSCKVQITTCPTP